MGLYEPDTFLAKATNWPKMPDDGQFGSIGFGLCYGLAIYLGKAAVADCINVKQNRHGDTFDALPIATDCRCNTSQIRRAVHPAVWPRLSSLRCIEPPEAMADWSWTSLQLKLIKIGACVVRHARAITFQLTEVAATGPMVRAILAAIRGLRALPSCA